MIASEIVEKQFERGMQLSIAWGNPGELDFRIPENRDFLMGLLGKLTMEYQELYTGIMHTTWDVNGIHLAKENLIEELFDMLQVSVGLARALGVEPKVEHLEIKPLAPITLNGMPKHHVLFVYNKPVVMFADIVNRIKRTKGDFQRNNGIELRKLVFEALSEMVWAFWFHNQSQQEVEFICKGKFERILFELNK